jgi:hypothetical protein
MVGMVRSNKQFNYEWGVVFLVAAIVSGAAHWLILDEVDWISGAMLLCFAVIRFSDGYQGTATDACADD